jgi:hypothetical protein
MFNITDINYRPKKLDEEIRNYKVILNSKIVLVLNQSIYKNLEIR